MPKAYESGTPNSRKKKIYNGEKWAREVPKAYELGTLDPRKKKSTTVKNRTMNSTRDT